MAHSEYDKARADYYETLKPRFLGIDCQIAIDGFDAGWQAAKGMWHKYPAEKPPLDKLVLCLTSKRRFAITAMHIPRNTDGMPLSNNPVWDDARYSGRSIIAWMELPDLPNFVKTSSK